MTPGNTASLDRLLSFVEGDQWSGLGTVEITLQSTGAAPTNDLSSVVIQYRRDFKTETIAHQLSTADATINISSAANWIISVPAQNIPLKSGKYVWGARFVDISGAKFTYLGSENVIVLPKIVL